MTKVLNKKIEIDTFILIDKIEDSVLIDNLLKVIYQNNQFHHTQTYVISKHSKFDFLNNNDFFHLFMKKIKKQINLIFKENFIIQDVWSVIYNNEDHALLHNHIGSTAFSGILYLTDGPGPGTYFPEYDLTIEEEAGKFVLFHGHLKHEVKKFKYVKDRVVIAFNFIKVGFLDEGTQVKIIK
jgi:hypothetical protein